MMASSNGEIFRVTGHFTGQRWIPRTKASDADICVFFDLRLNKQWSKQSWGWWFETPSRSLWRHRNDSNITCYVVSPTFSNVCLHYPFPCVLLFILITTVGNYFALPCLLISVIDNSNFKSTRCVSKIDRFYWFLGWRVRMNTIFSPEMYEGNFTTLSIISHQLPDNN